MIGLKSMLLLCGTLVAWTASVSAADFLNVGWAEADVTPPLTKRVPLDGQYYQRLADMKDPVHTRLKFVAVAFQRGGDYFLEGTIDNECVWGPWQDRVRARVRELVPEVAPEHVFINCIHTHCAPAIRHSGTPKGAQMEKDQPDVWGPNEYADFALERAAGAFAEAWRNRRPGGIRRAFGTARIGHCRLALYADGSAQMYGDTSRPDFVRMLESEDDGVEMLFTVDAAGKYTGVIANVACPAQVMEATYQISSDIAGETREKLKKVYGDGFRMIYQIGAAGCQSPRDLVRGCRDGFHGWNAASCSLLSDRLVKCITEAAPRAVETAPTLKHEKFSVKVPRRRVTDAEAVAAAKALAAARAVRSDEAAWDEFLATVKANEAKGGPGPYDDKELDFIGREINKAIVQRFKDQVTQPDLTFEMHVVRLGDVAFATCPFELYLAYGQSIKARSAAKQTFVVEQCGGTYGYVPTPAAETARGYGGGVNNGQIGHEGAFMLCDRAVEGINRLFK